MKLEDIKIGAEYRDTKSGFVGVASAGRPPSVRDRVDVNGRACQVLSLHPSDPEKVAVVDENDEVAVIEIASLAEYQKVQITGVGPKGAVERRNVSPDRLEEVN